MRLEHSFIFPLPNGLHARPATRLQELANPFQADIRFLNRRSGREADAKSVLSLVSADVKHGDPCLLAFTGPEADAARDAFIAFLAGGFLRCDEPLVPAPAPVGSAFLPRSLRQAQPEDWLGGAILCPGIGWGKALVFGGLGPAPAPQNQTAGEPRKEVEEFRRAVESVSADLDRAISQSANPQARGVLQAHRAMLRDSALAAKVEALIAEGSTTAAQAIVAAGEFFSATLRAAESLYLRERALDISDVCHRLLAAIGGQAATAATVSLRGPTVCVAPNLTPGQLLALDRRYLQALVLGEAGATSHTIILARSFGIPTLGGVPEAPQRLSSGQEVIVDANCGILIPRVSPSVARHYQREQHAAELRQARWQTFQHQPAVTSDGRRIEVGANVASADEAARAFQSGAEGIGLFRTEMLFLDRACAPSEEEQTAVYSALAQAAAGRSVIVRLFDIGGDKPAPYLGLPQEKNPFLGHRGVRLYSDFAGLVKTQLRAILRAAVHGPLKIMVPMISRAEEMRAVKALLAEAREELVAGAIRCERPVELGAMLEIPAVAFAMPELCRDADFFSIGTNDLAQYFFAADRDNPKVAPMHSPAHPAFLRLLKQLVVQAHAQNRWVGLCGGMAEIPALLPILLGLGLDEISLSIPRLGPTKGAIRQLPDAACRVVLNQALSSATEAEVGRCLQAFRAGPGGMPLLIPQLVMLDSDARTKGEVIRELVHALQLESRTSQPDLVEEEIWLREESYSTGFGRGFAIPHCQSEHLSANTLAVLKTREPIDWGSLDNQPVRNVLLLAIRKDQADREHLKVLARLSRLLMRDEFQDRLRTETNSESLAVFIQESIYE